MVKSDKECFHFVGNDLKVFQWMKCLLVLSRSKTLDACSVGGRAGTPTQNVMKLQTNFCRFNDTEERNNLIILHIMKLFLFVLCLRCKAIN